MTDKRVPILIAVLLGSAAVVASGGSSTGGSGGSGDSGGSSAACSQDYPDKQPDNDHCADASGKVTGVGNFDVTAKPFTYKKIQYIGKSICSTVTLHNKTDKSQDYNVFDFKVQTPGGDIESFSSAGIGETLDSGTLIAGATKKGKVCSDFKGNGQYVLIFKPGLISDNRGIWLFKVKAK